MRDIQVHVESNRSTEVWTVQIPELGLTFGGAGDKSTLCHSVAGSIASAKGAHRFGDAVVVASPAADGVTASIYTREDLGVGFVMAATENFAQRENSLKELFTGLAEGAVLCVIRPQPIDPRALDRELDELYKKFRK